MFQLFYQESLQERLGQGLWQDNAGSYSGKQSHPYGAEILRGNSRGAGSFASLSSSLEMNFG